jgi:hypothetical protein
VSGAGIAVHVFPLPSFPIASRASLARSACRVLEEELASLGQKLGRGCQASIWERRRLLQTFRTKDPEDPVGALAKAWGGTEDAWRSWLFRKDEVMRFTLNNDANQRLARTELLIIDECSMVDEQIGRDWR